MLLQVKVNVVVVISAPVKYEVDDRGTAVNLGDKLQLWEYEEVHDNVAPVL